MERIIKEIKIPKEKIWIMGEGTSNLQVKRKQLKGRRKNKRKRL